MTAGLPHILSPAPLSQSCPPSIKHIPTALWAVATPTQCLPSTPLSIITHSTTHRIHPPPVLILLYLWNIHSSSPPLPLLDNFSYPCSCPPTIFNGPPQIHIMDCHTLFSLSMSIPHTNLFRNFKNNHRKPMPAAVVSPSYFKTKEWRELPLLRNLRREVLHMVFLRVGYLAHHCKSAEVPP